MDEITLFLSILIIGLASILFIVSILSSYRLRNLKFFLISFAFLAFMIKGTMLTFEIISQDIYGLIIDVIVIILLYFAIIKK